MTPKNRTRLAGLLALSLALLVVFALVDPSRVGDELDVRDAPRAGAAPQRTVAGPESFDPGRERRHDASLDASSTSSDGVDVDSPHVIRFTNPQGSPVPFVAVFARSSNPSKPIAESDGKGLASLSLALEAPARFTASHLDYLVTEFSPVPSGGAPQDVVLDPGSSIQGHVRFVDGSAGFDDVRVLAAPFGRLPSPTQVERALDGAADPTGSVRITEPDAAGRFTIRGLRVGRRYYVTAAGVQCLARSGLEGIEPSEDPVELQLDWLHGIRLHVAESDRPLQVSASVQHARGVQVQLPNHLPPQRHWEAALGWIPAEDLEPEPEHDSVHLALGGGRLDLGAALKLDASLPGYARATRFIALLPAVRHISVENVLLTPRGGGWSTLVVEVHGLEPAGTEVPGSQGPAGVLTLFDGLEPLYQVELRDLSAGARSRHSVPSGHYQASFRALAGRHRWPSSPDSVSLDLTQAEAHLVLPLNRACGALELSLIDRSGEPYEDRALIRLQREERSGYEHVRFLRAPYAFHAFEPGTYAVAAINGPAFLAPGREPFRGEVEVRAGEWATLLLREE